MTRAAHLCFLNSDCSATLSTGMMPVLDVAITNNQPVLKIFLWNHNSLLQEQARLDKFILSLGNSTK